MSDAAIEAAGELGRQADHHRHGLTLPGVAAGDDMVVGRSRLALEVPLLLNLPPKQDIAKRPADGPSLVNVPSQTRSPRELSTLKVTERSRPIRAP